MIDYFDRMYNSIGGEDIFFFKKRLYSLMRFFVRMSANCLLPIYFHLTRSKLEILDYRSIKPRRIVVSLTTFPLRINNLWMVIETLLRQTRKPDKIVLWLSIDQFATLDELPSRLLALRKYGLDIRLCENDIRSHKKYFYALQEFSNDFIITVDDDIFYPTTMIESLMDANKQHPFSIICRYAFQMRYFNDKLAPYNYWTQLYSFVPPNFTTFFGSGGGTLFPPNSLHSDVLNMKVFTAICLLADDVWLNAMARLNNTTIIKLNCSNTLLPVINKNNIALHSRNVGDNMNDKQLTDVSSYCLVKHMIDPFNQ